MSVSYWLDQKQKRKKVSTDICIIGGGHHRPLFGLLAG
jgi:hypothetical protein